MAGGGTGVNCKSNKGGFADPDNPDCESTRSRAMIQSDAKQIARSNLAYISLE